jgi:hypothetical protein
MGAASVRLGVRLALRGILLLSSRREIARGFGLCLPGRAVRLDDTEWSEMDLDDLANVWRSSPPGQFLPSFASSFFSRLATPVAPRSRA